MIPVVLASTSASRAAVLTGAGVPFTARSPGVDEDAAKAALLAEGAGPREVADALAELKAVRVSMRVEGLVIGADQTLDLDGTLFDKPASLDEARERLKALRGRMHRLHAGVVVARAGEPIWRDVQTSTLWMRPFSDSYLEDYLAAEGEASLKAVGCYRLEGIGAQLFSRIQGDYFAILGMPLLGLLDLLRQHGAMPT
jgi:septum formation protein